VPITPEGFNVHVAAPPVSAHENKTIVGKSGRVVNVAGQGERRLTYAAVTFSSGNLRTYLDVLDLGEGVGGDVVVAEERGDEGAGLALSAPVGDG